ncbi:MAG: acyltransferase family protein [Lachnospiraceae bacterium]|nr:acyltransferase family protein [Lachnospiraceae bacterium]
MANDERRYYMDILRIMAIYVVIFAHSVGFTLYTDLNPDRFTYWIYMFCSQPAAGAVPMFLMISGALLLKKNEPYTYILRHRVLRMVVVLLLFSFVWFFYLLWKGEKRELIDLFLSIYTDPWCIPYWYLYLYIGYLLILPVLRAVAQNIDKKTMRILLFWGFCMIVVLPVTETFGFPHLNDHIRPTLLAGITFFYPLLGYYLDQMLILEDITKRKWIAIWIANLLIFALSMFLTYKSGIYGGQKGDMISYVAPLNNIALYLTMKKCMKASNIPDKCKKIIMTFGESVFGIYLVHSIVDGRIRQHIDIVGILQALHVNQMIAVLVYCFIVFMVSAILVLLLKKSTFFSRIL